MSDQLLYVACGLSAGLLAGYLGVGGGIIMVPFLTIIAGVDIKAAVPVSMTAIIVNSFAASNEYLKKGMVDLELVIILSIFTAMGSITGSLLSSVIPGSYTRLLLTLVLIYTAFSLLKGRKTEDTAGYTDNRLKYLMVCTVVALATGVLSALVGIGGGVILVPVLFLVVGVPLTTARGTSSLMTGLAATAATAVYFLGGAIDFKIVPGVVLGIMLGGKLGGFLGTMAKPAVVKILFFIIMLYLAFKLSYQPIMEWL